MDEKMKAAFSLWRRDQEFPPLAHEIADWVLDYLRSQQEPVAWQNTINGFIARQRTAEYQRPLYAAPIPSAPAVPEGWLSAVDTEMITTYLGVANSDDDYETARKKLGQIIDWHVAVALDPAVNGGWKLVPVEPTAEMLVQGDGWAEGTAYETYKGMLDAAPSPDEKETDND